MNLLFSLFLLASISICAAHDAVHLIGAENENGDLDAEELDELQPFSFAGEMLLLEWLPFPINMYKYIILNSTTGFSTEEGTEPIEHFTQERYPDVRVALACVEGDGEFIYLENIPVISVDAFKNDKYFQEYQDIIFTIHAFTYKVELWAHFLQYQDAFWPVRDRLSGAFQDYLENPTHKDAEPPKVIYENPPVEDFVEKPKSK